MRGSCANGRRAIERVPLDRFHGTVERDPAHDLRMRELARLTAHFPDSVIGPSQIFSRYSSSVFCRFQATGLLFEPVTLAACNASISSPYTSSCAAGWRRCRPHRPAVLVAVQPGQLVLGQPAPARDAVHDLHFRRMAGDGAQQPLAPGARLVPVAGVQQRVERQRRVTDPAEPIIPVPDAAERFRQRGRRRRDDAAGRRIGEQLQRDQRTNDRLTPRPLQRAAARPVAPCVLGFEKMLLRIAIAVSAMVRGIPAHRERHGVTGLDDELARRRQVLRAVQRNRGDELHRIRAGNTARPAEMRANPRNSTPVIEAQDDFGVHSHAAAVAANHPDQVNLIFPSGQRHEVDDRDAPSAVSKRVSRMPVSPR